MKLCMNKFDETILPAIYANFKWPERNKVNIAMTKVLEALNVHSNQFVPRKLEKYNDKTLL